MHAHATLCSSPCYVARSQGFFATGFGGRCGSDAGRYPRRPRGPLKGAVWRCAGAGAKRSLPRAFRPRGATVTAPSRRSTDPATGQLRGVQVSSGEALCVDANGAVEAFLRLDEAEAANRGLCPKARVGAAFGPPPAAARRSPAPLPRVKRGRNRIRRTLRIGCSLLFASSPGKAEESSLPIRRRRSQTLPRAFRPRGTTVAPPSD